MITLDEWQRQGHYESIHGHQIFTRYSGDKSAPVLLLIHGYPSASWDWEGMWDALTNHYYVITLDMLGFGLSDKPKNARYLISEQADIYQAVLEKLGVSDYHILAHDYGDTVAQELLARQVEGSAERHIASVCFLNGGLFPETHKPILVQKLLLSPLGPLVSKLINYMPQRQQYRERWVGAIIDSTVPVKLIAGAKDPISGQHMIDRYRQLIPNADITNMPMLGHYPQIEDSAAITAAYLQFRRSIL